MKTQHYNILLIGLLILVFQSCTIEKRRYSSGYHIDRNSRPKDITHAKHRPVKDEQELPQITATNTSIGSDSLLKSPTSTVEAIPNENKISEPTSTQTTHSKTNRFAEKLKPKALQSLHWQGTHVKVDAIGEENEKKTSPLAIATIIIGFIGLLTMIIAMVAVEGWTALGYVILAVMIAFICFIVGVLTLLIDKKKGLHIPFVFYLFFGLAAIISIWVTFGLLATRLGLI